MRSRDKVSYGLLIDIGSGSVGFAIAAVEPKKKPQIIWRTREYTRLQEANSVATNCKALLAILTEVSLRLPNEGLVALRDYTNSTKATISQIQVTVAAPWSYTVSRKVTYEQTEPFKITSNLLQDLATAAGEEAIELFRNEYDPNLASVTETSHCVLDTYANGYRLPHVNNQLTTNVELTHTTTLIQTSIQQALGEMRDKIFSDVPLHITSSVLGVYFATKKSKPHVYDVCLVDITDEATEIGIVRDGSLTYCTHTAIGAVQLARVLSKKSKRPLQEIASRLSDSFTQLESKHTNAILEEYQEEVVSLFRETGDSLSIPRTVYLVAEKNTITILQPVIERAAKLASKTNTTVIPVNDFIGTKGDTQYDTGLDIAARFFHTTKDTASFVYL